LGLILGWPTVLVGLLVGILLGGAFSLVFLVSSALLRRYRSFVALPYAPFLVAGAGLIIYLPDFTRALLADLSPLLGVVMTR
jgi:prepilin signal peptidase PulO-like enzyme (type II secretory pathway)